MTTTFESRFRLIGVRVSQLSLDEKTALENGEGEIKFHISTSVREPRVSEYRFNNREVIELSVMISAGTSDDQVSGSEVLALECTAGFVGVESNLDGSIEAFKETIEFYARGVYWMTRARLDSVLSVTLLRSLGALPWDLVTESSTQQRKKKSVVSKTSKRQKK